MIKKTIKKRIIIDNAYESWRLSIKTCDEILEGNISLTNKKLFVSSLHNAIELFFKQIMLDNNDYRVAKFNSIASNGSPAKQFYISEDLNRFFLTTNCNYKSIEFSELIKIHKNILPSYFVRRFSYKNQLELINKLRNQEIHFGIEYKEFLTDDEFMELYNFMIDFYHMLRNNSEFFPFFGKAYGDYKRMEFDRKKMTSCSYVDILKKSNYIKSISSIINNNEYLGNPTDDPFSIAECIYETMHGIKDITTFDKLFEHIKVLYDNDYIDFDYGQTETYLDETGRETERYISYIIYINISKKS